MRDIKMGMFIGIIIGMIVMDFLWAWRLGLAQMLFHRWTDRFRQWRDTRKD
jgi:hypothetical protein